MIKRQRIVTILSWITAIMLTLGGGGIMLLPMHQNALVYNAGVGVFLVGCLLACVTGILAISKKS
jgi:hypothetical protein